MSRRTSKDQKKYGFIFDKKKDKLNSYYQLLDILIPTDGKKPSVVSISNENNSEESVDISYDLKPNLARAITFGKFSNSTNTPGININHIVELAFILRIFTNNINIGSEDSNTKISTFLQKSIMSNMKDYIDKNVKKNRQQSILVFLNTLPFSIMYFLTQVTDELFMSKNTTNLESSISADSLNKLDMVFNFGNNLVNDDTTSFESIHNWSNVADKFMYVKSIIFNRYNRVFEEIFKIEDTSCKELDKNEFYDIDKCHDEDKNLKFITLGSTFLTKESKHNSFVGQRWISILSKIYPFIQSTDAEMQNICLLLMVYIDIYHQESFIHQETRHNSFKHLFDVGKNQETIMNIFQKNSIISTLRTNTQRKLLMYLCQNDNDTKYRFTTITNVLQLLKKKIIKEEDRKLINIDIDNETIKTLVKHIEAYVQQSQDTNNPLYESQRQLLTNILLQNNNYLTLAFILNDYYGYLRKNNVISYNCIHKDSISPSSNQNLTNIVEINQQLITILLDQEGLNILLDNFKTDNEKNKHIIDFFTHLTDIKQKKISMDDFLIEYLLAWFVETIYDLGQSDINHFNIHVKYNTDDKTIQVLTHAPEKGGVPIQTFYIGKNYKVTNNDKINITVTNTMSDDNTSDTNNSKIVDESITFKENVNTIIFSHPDPEEKVQPLEFSIDKDQFECIKQFEDIKQVFNFISNGLAVEDIIKKYVKETPSEKEPHVLAYCFIKHLLKTYEPQTGGSSELSYILQINYLDNL